MLFDLKIFTDGSKDASKAFTGCAFAIPSLNYSQMFKVNEHLIVYTTELIAVPGRFARESFRP